MVFITNRRSGMSCVTIGYSLNFHLLLGNANIEAFDAFRPVEFWAHGFAVDCKHDNLSDTDSTGLLINVL